ncbi:MAG: N-acetylmuramoyl-L-alanine amidase [Cytophagaceae bacterium]|jgi:N-acetylmuramoyl-L-alanine amidase|nr:N-acetylmuramoyl-L-alanine amidase [Cytophagaceae bacterium]
MLYLSKTLLLVCAIACIGDVWAQANKSGSFKTVVIDAGHGGKDPGAIGKSVKEKDIVLNVALKVGEYLKKELPELEVIYTRKNDIFVELDERAEIANHAKADLFVSIHANSISNPKIHGAETFVLGLHRSQENLEVAKKENSVIVLEDDYTTKYEGFDPNSTESYIIFELMQNIYLDQSLEAASIIQEQFEERVGRHNRGVKQAGFLVLRKTAMPSILVELGFLSNKNEEKFMSEEEGQTYLASAIFRSIRDYRNKFEARNSIVKQIEKDVIEFRIQIAASNSELKKDAAPYKLFNDVWMFKDGKQYKYTTGLASDYGAISRELEKVKKKVPDCFIVAFKNGEKVPVSSVR